MYVFQGGGVCGVGLIGAQAESWRGILCIKKRGFALFALSV